MYLYLYAPFLKHKKYASDLALFEGRVTDFGISGKVVQLSQFLKFPAAIKEFGLKRLTTLVLVGDDALFEEAISHFALSQVVLGFIPIGETIYGPALSLPAGIQAVEALAARRILKVDLGSVEKRFFLGSLRCEGSDIELHSLTYSIFPNGHAVIEVKNMGEGADPTDGLLDVSIIPFDGKVFKKAGQASHLKLTSCRLKSQKPMTVECSGQGTLKTPLQVDIVSKAIRIIVGRSVKTKK